jgi:hypothetical protein
MMPGDPSCTDSATRSPTPLRSLVASERFARTLRPPPPHIYAPFIKHSRSSALPPPRVSPVAHAKDAYALIDIQWQGTKGDNADPPHLLFRCFDAVSNTIELTYRINLDELRPAPDR